MVTEIQLKEFSRTGELAETFGVSDRTIRNWLKREESNIRIIRLPKFFLVHSGDFSKFVNSKIMSEDFKVVI